MTATKRCVLIRVSGRTEAACSNSDGDRILLDDVVGGAAEGTVKGQAGYLDGLVTGNSAVATNDSFDTQPPADLEDCRIVLKPGEWPDQEVRQ